MVAYADPVATRAQRRGGKRSDSLTAGLSAVSCTDSFVALQRTLGNAAVGRLISARAGVMPVAGGTLQRVPIRVHGSRPARLKDLNIPGATLIYHGRRLRDGRYEYEVEETNVHFFYDHDTDRYYDLADNPINPQRLSPPAPPPVMVAVAPGWPGDGGGGGEAIAAGRSRAQRGRLVPFHGPKREREEDEHELMDGSERAKRRRTRWLVIDQFALDLGVLYGPTLSRAIDHIFGGIPVIHVYDMEGAQRATTTAQGRQFSTTLQMHSEMCALGAMLASNIYRLEGGRVLPRAPLRGFRFETPTAPHCGFCTFFLQLLGLPLSRPSMGRFQYASQLAYPLPPEIFNSIHVLNALFEHGGARPNAMSRIVALAATGGAADWDDFVRKGYLAEVWRLVMARLNRYLETKR